MVACTDVSLSLQPDVGLPGRHNALRCLVQVGRARCGGLWNWTLINFEI